MIATLLFQECPLIVMITAGRLPPPTASATSGGTSKPLMSSGGSTVADLIEEAGSAVAAQQQMRAHLYGTNSLLDQITEAAVAPRPAC